MKFLKESRIIEVKQDRNHESRKSNDSASTPDIFNGCVPEGWKRWPFLKLNKRGQRMTEMCYSINNILNVISQPKSVMCVTFLLLFESWCQVFYAYNLLKAANGGSSCNSRTPDIFMYIVKWFHFYLGNTRGRNISPLGPIRVTVNCASVSFVA